MNNLDLLEHHIYFLSKNRGRRELGNNIEYIHSDKLDFNIAIPLASDSIGNISSNFYVFLAPWISREKLLTNWKKAGSLSYMNLSKMENDWKANNDIVVKKAVTETDLTDFSLLQGKGFCETDEEFNEWHPWLKAWNFKNFPDENQNYYVAYKDDLPVGICLCLLHKNVAGIYAVTTLPEYRKQAVSTTIMKHVINELKENKITSVTLQVSTNSYAHTFYKKLGFEDVFECEILANAP